MVYELGDISNLRPQAFQRLSKRFKMIRHFHFLRLVREFESGHFLNLYDQSIRETLKLIDRESLPHFYTSVEDFRNSFFIVQTLGLAYFRKLFIGLLSGLLALLLLCTVDVLLKFATKNRCRAFKN